MKFPRHPPRNPHRPYYEAQNRRVFCYVADIVRAESASTSSPPYGPIYREDSLRLLIDNRTTTFVDICAHRIFFTECS